MRSGYGERLSGKAPRANAYRCYPFLEIRRFNPTYTQMFVAGAGQRQRTLANVMKPACRQDFVLTCVAAPSPRRRIGSSGTDGPLTHLFED